MAKRLMEEARNVFRAHHYSYRTEVTYLKWIKRFIKYHGNRPPRELGPAEIQAFLTDLATRGKVSASTQNQALSALPFLDEVIRAKRPVRVPVVLTRAESAKVLNCMMGQHWLMAGLLYGSGLRISECLNLRVQDVDFQYLQLTVRNAKGSKDRLTILSESLILHLEQQLDVVRGLLARDRERGREGVSMPDAIGRKYVNAGLSWRWQYIFPSRKYAFIRSNMGRRRHHSHPSGLSRAVKIAVEEVEVPSAPRPTHFGTHLQRISSRAATTFAPYRSSSATPT